MAQKRYPIIDVLRGISILLVVMTHVQLRIPFEKTSLLADLPHAIWSFLFRSGNEGVRIFFVISGFLITTTSLQRWGKLSKINFRAFYQLRFARIVPCLLALLGVLSAFHFFRVENFTINTERVSYVRALFSALTFHVNWLEGKFGYLPGAWDILWSLSVEEVFYLFFPWVCLLFRRPWAGYAALGLFVVFGPLSRVLTTDNYIWQSKSYFSCMDSIALGCIAALLTHGKSISPKRIKALALGGGWLMLIVLLFKKDPGFAFLVKSGLDKTILSLGTACVLVAGVRQKLSDWIQKALSPIAAYGRLSYEVYLTHMFIVFGGIALYRKSGASLDGAYLWLMGIILVSGALGYVIERTFSAPMNRRLRPKFSAKSQIARSA